MIKIDLHTHSTASPDGGVSAAHYRQVLESGLLDCIAITDHNRVDFALELHKELDERIIVGEEIMTTEGEIVGLFLKDCIQPGLTPEKTIEQIKSQNALVYIPHPFESVRKGLNPATLDRIADQVDIIEICNGRAFLQNRSQQTVVWTRLNHKHGAASSDAHGVQGLGKTYTRVAELPSRKTLLELLKQGTPITDRPGLRALLYPKYHRVRKKLTRGK